MTVAVGMILLLAAWPASSESKLEFKGSGYSYVFFAGRNDTMTIDGFYAGNSYGEAHPVVLDVEALGGHYVGMIRANPDTVEALALVYDGQIQLTQAYSDGQGQDGYVGSSLASGALGILWASGFYTALLAEAPFEISQYGGRSNPELTYGLNMNSGSSTGGQGYSEMWGQLYENWYYPSYTIFEYLPVPIWEEPEEGDPQAGGYLQLTGADGLNVDISASSTAPITYIEAYYHSQWP